VLTIVVRMLLIPVGLSQVRGEIGRARIAPQLKELQRKHGKNPQLLSEKTLALYKSEGVSMFAGIGPALLQTPVLM
ncbi:YidC/Oxa1 family membrane protein insertase, partial [Escherichia coli]|nr:YidC/Oxa1 family membrane protein insertase [Escherichia coli]